MEHQFLNGHKSIIKYFTMIIITGASKGIGKFLFDIYNNQGVKVIGTYNTNQQYLNNYYKLDITDESQVNEFYSTNSSQIKNITLINCAGINVNGNTSKIDSKVFREILEVNVTGSFLMIKYALNIMREDRYGRIINISSVVPQIGLPGTAAYSSSKTALWGLTKTVANENASMDITCNCLNLGYFDIGMISEVPLKTKDSILSRIPMKRFGDPINIYNAVEFLRNSNYITGAFININGGIY